MRTPLLLFLVVAAAACGGNVVVDEDAGAGGGPLSTPPGPCLSPRVQCGTTCADLTGDPDNCGACGHSCQGGACSGSTCQPLTLASGHGDITAIVVDGTEVYFSDLYSGVAKVPAAGGPEVQVAEDPAGGANSLAADATDVYWTDAFSGNVSHVSKAGGAPIVLAKGQSNPANVVVQGGLVYWTSNGSQSGAIWSVPVTGGTPVEVTSAAGGTVSPDGLALDATRIYWSGGQGILALPLAGGAAEVVGNGGFVAGNGTDVYNLDLQGAIHDVSSPGATLPTGTGTMGAFAVDGADAYVNLSMSLLQVPLDGSPVTTLTAVSGMLYGGIAVDAKSVYWSTGPTLLKLAKP